MDYISSLEGIHAYCHIYQQMASVIIGNVIMHNSFGLRIKAHCLCILIHMGEARQAGPVRDVCFV